jgi:hypothetical protein
VRLGKRQRSIDILQEYGSGRSHVTYEPSGYVSIPDIAQGPDLKDKHVMVCLHIDMLVERILRFEGVEVDLWEVLSRKVRMASNGRLWRANLVLSQKEPGSNNPLGHTLGHKLINDEEYGENGTDVDS